MTEITPEHIHSLKSEELHKFLDELVEKTKNRQDRIFAALEESIHDKNKNEIKKAHDLAIRYDEDSLLRFTMYSNDLDLTSCVHEIRGMSQYECFSLENLMKYLHMILQIHDCPEWDGMEIDNKMDEFEACLCYEDENEIHPTED